MRKTRIVKRTDVDGTVKYFIQQKHFLFRWYWVDGWMNSLMGPAHQDFFPTLKEAQNNLCYFNGSKPKEEIVG